jgi:hypothetical protein
MRKTRHPFSRCVARAAAVRLLIMRGRLLVLLLVACSSEATGPGLSPGVGGSPPASVAGSSSGATEQPPGGQGAAPSAGAGGSEALATEGGEAAGGTETGPAGTGGNLGASGSGGSDSGGAAGGGVAPIAGQSGSGGSAGSGGAAAGASAGASFAGQGGSGESGGGGSGGADPCGGVKHWDPAEQPEDYEPHEQRVYAGKLWGHCGNVQLCRVAPGRWSYDTGWTSIADCQSGPIVEPAPPCECTEGACCDGCYVRPSFHLCGEAERSSQCIGAATAACSVGTRTRDADHWTLFCDGSSPGACTRWGSHTKYTTGSCSGKTCVEDGEHASCVPCPD